MKPFEYIVATYLYLYERCIEHEKCFNLKHNDDDFYLECEFVAKSASWCMTDVNEKLRELL